MGNGCNYGISSVGGLNRDKSEMTPCAIVLGVCTSVLEASLIIPPLCNLCERKKQTVLQLARCLNFELKISGGQKKKKNKSKFWLLTLVLFRSLVLQSQKPVIYLLLFFL